MAQSNLPSTTNVQLNAGDIALGGVEIKDADGSARVAVVTGANNLANGNQMVTAAVLYGYDGSTYDRIAFVTPVSGMSNPTGAIAVVSHLMGYDYSNTTWNRLRATEQYGLQVDITRSGSLTVNTELSAAAALADNTVNPTTSLIGACILGFDGTAWDRVTNGGGVEATALRVTIANDSTGVVSVDDNGSALTVDWAGTAPPIGAGTEAAALRVTIATDSTGVLSIDDNSASLTVDNAAPSVTGGGAEATALRVTLASDSTGVVSVDDNAGSLTIDNAQLSVVGSGAEATALRVTIATDSTGVLSVDDNGGALTVDNGGKFAVQATGTVADDATTPGNPVVV